MTEKQIMENYIDYFLSTLESLKYGESIRYCGRETGDNWVYIRIMPLQKTHVSARLVDYIIVNFFPSNNFSYYEIEQMIELKIDKIYYNIK